MEYSICEVIIELFQTSLCVDVTLVAITHGKQKVLMHMCYLISIFLPT